jgi:archaellum component FlaC
VADAERLDAIFNRLGNIERESSTHHARMEGEMARVADKLGALDERIRVQNGRVTKLENQMGDLQMHARIHDKDAAEADERTDAMHARMWAFIVGSAVALVAGLLGYFL